MIKSASYLYWSNIMFHVTIGQNHQGYKDWSECQTLTKLPYRNWKTGIWLKSCLTTFPFCVGSWCKSRSLGWGWRWRGRTWWSTSPSSTVDTSPWLGWSCWPWRWSSSRSCRGGSCPLAPRRVPRAWCPAGLGVGCCSRACYTFRKVWESLEKFW